MECALEDWFEKIGDLYYMRSKDGEHTLPVLFCPLCGRKMVGEGSE